jgi:hypothetical protein
MNNAFRTRIAQWNIIVLNFEFMLVFNHDDVIWDYPKKEDMGKKRKIFGHTILKK